MDSENCEWPSDTGCDRLKPPPAGPGRPPKYCGLPDDVTGVVHTAENRARYFPKQAPPATPGAVPAGPVSPEGAQSALAEVLKRLAAVVVDRRRQDEARRAQDEAFADALENALAGVSDPEAVDAALDACRTEAERTVAEALAQVAAEKQRTVRAEADARTAAADAEEARAEVERLTARLAEVEHEVAEAALALDRERVDRATDAAVHDERLAALQEERAAELAERDAGWREAIERINGLHAAQMDEATRAAADAAATATRELEGITARLTAEETARARAEDTATALRGDLDRVSRELAALRAEQPALIEAARDETRAALAGQHAAEVAAVRATAAGDVARVQGKLDACEERRQAATETIAGLRARLNPKDTK